MNRELRAEILNEIKPNGIERAKIELIVDEVLRVVGNALKKSGYKCSLFVGGSFGKDTYLKGGSDIDVFARFDKSYEDSKISGFLNEALVLCGFNLKREKGSRDYFSFDFRGVKFELVPNRRIGKVSDMMNSTDVSPLHVEFLREKVLKNKRLCDEIRLAKQFFKAKGLYGAESYINGFSGHVIDILIAFYGSLEKLLVAAKNWGEETFIDINSFYSSFEVAKKKISSDKHSALFVVDPILKDRNASRALSFENYSKFLLVAANFDIFRERDFVVFNFDLHSIIKDSKRFAKQNNLRVFFYIFDLDTSIGSSDIIGSKLLKLSCKFDSFFKQRDFNVFKKEFFVDMKKEQSLFVFFFEKVELARVRRVLGPKVFMRDAVSSFLKKRDVFFVENDRLYSYEKRDVIRVDDVARFSLDDCFDMSSRDMSFLKKLRVIRY